MARKASESSDAEIECHLDRVLEERHMTLTELSSRVGISIANLSVLKNNRAQAVRFSTLYAVCSVLQCDVGDILTLAPTRTKSGPHSDRS